MVELSVQDAIDRFNNLPKSVQQAIIGSTSGWLTGFTLVKFGRYAGFSMGASILLIQLGHHYGYISIDWKNVNRDLKKAKEEVEKQANNHLPDLSARIQRGIKDNAVTASTFLGGFLLGASSA
uniref:FUN14 domain-containing protein 1 n=1 Tax=Aceria tosichella TaxID=561515 RepID=A0A6G1SE20_9ACAR